VKIKILIKIIFILAIISTVIQVAGIWLMFLLKEPLIFVNVMQINLFGIVFIWHFIRAINELKEITNEN